MRTLFKLLAVVAAATLLPASNCQAQFSEDFNSGTLGGWTVNDILGGSDVIGWDLNSNVVDGSDVRANFTTGDAGAIHVDSDAFGTGAGAYNIAIESPIFNVGTETDIGFFHMFRSIDGTDFGHVEISNDGGATWNTETTYTDTQGTIPGFPYTTPTAGGVQDFVSLAAYQGQDIQLRFRYEGDSWDWWWQVDNVATVASAIPEPSAIGIIGLAGMVGLIRRRR
jgi:hypothetical protein